MTGDPTPRPLVTLLRKEWAVLQPRYRAGYALIFLLGALQTVRSDEAYLWLGVLLAGALALTVPVIEWRLDADRLIASLPVRRRSIVAARYLASAAAIVTAFAVWAIAGSILGPVLADGLPEPRIWADLPGALTFFALAGLLIVAFLPLYFATGLGRAAAIFPVVAAGLVAIIGWVASLAARAALAGAGPEAAGPGGAPLIPPGAAVRQVAARTADTIGAGGAAAVGLGGLLILLALSARVSVAAFRRREL